MNVKLENHVNIENFKKEMQKTIDGLQLPYQYPRKDIFKRTHSINILISALAFLLSIVYSSMKLSIVSLILLCLSFLVLVIDIICLISISKIKKENHALLTKEIEQINNIEDIPSVIEKADLMQPVADISILNDYTCSFSKLVINKRNIYKFFYLSENKIIDVDISQKKFTVEENNGNVKEISIDGELIRNINISDVIIKLIDDLTFRIVVPYKLLKEGKIRNEAIMNYSVAVLAEVAERAKQEDTPIYEGDKEVDLWVRLSDVNEAINKHLN